MNLFEIIGMGLIVIGLIAGAFILYFLKDIAEKVISKVAMGIVIITIIGGGVTTSIGGDSEMDSSSSSTLDLSQTEHEKEEKKEKKEIEEESISSNNIKDKAPEEEESRQKEYKVLKEFDIKTAYASSTLDDGLDIAYEPNLVADGDTSSAWVEGDIGDGINEWIEVELYGTKKIHEVKIVGGYAENTELFYKNNRPKMIKLSFADGTEVIKTLRDGKIGEQTIKLDRPVESSYVTVTILEVYQGNKYSDTCISEIAVVGSES